MQYYFTLNHFLCLWIFSLIKSFIFVDLLQYFFDIFRDWYFAAVFFYVFYGLIWHYLLVDLLHSYFCFCFLYFALYYYFVICFSDCFLLSSLIYSYKYFYIFKNFVRNVLLLCLLNFASYTVTHILRSYLNSHLLQCYYLFVCLLLVWVCHFICINFYSNILLRVYFHHSLLCYFLTHSLSLFQCSAGVSALAVPLRHSDADGER